MNNVKSDVAENSGGELTPAGQLTAAMERGVSALVISRADGAALLAVTTSRLSETRTRVFRVRPPYDLTSFMRQIAPSASDEALLEEGYRILASSDSAYRVTALLAEDAHLLPKVTLRYIEALIRTIPHLCIALVGPPEIYSLLVKHDLVDLQKKLSVRLESPDHAAPPARIAVSAPSQASSATERSSWLRVAGIVGIVIAVCIGFVAAFLPDLLFHVDRRVAAVQVQAPPVNVPAAMVPEVPNPPSPSAPSPSTSSQFTSSPSTPEPSALLAAQAIAAAPPDPIAPAMIDPAPPVTTPPLAAVAPAVVASAPPEAAPAILEPSMVSLAGGEFLMGSNDDLSERPSHHVVLAPFLLSEKAVTVREWQACVDAKACLAVSKGKPDEPITNVNWDDARRYAVWLSQSTHHQYRLPTEAEWEYAARSGTTSRYYWGNTMLPGRVSCKGCGEAVSLQKPPAVDAYPPNPAGLYGMGGGAAEWVSDCWHRNYQGAPRDGSTPWAALDCREHVLRGGSWVDEAGALRVSSRDLYDSSVRYPTHGFRVARSN